MGNTSVTTEKGNIDTSTPGSYGRLGSQQIESYQRMWDKIKSPGKDTATAISVETFLNSLWTDQLSELAKCITKSLQTNFGSDGAVTRTELLQLLVPFCTRDCNKQTKILYSIFLEGRASASKAEIRSIFHSLALIVTFLYDKTGKVPKDEKESSQIKRFVCKPLVKSLFSDDSIKAIPEMDFAQWLNSNLPGLYSSSFESLIYSTFFPCDEQESSNVWQLPEIDPSPILPRHSAWLLGAMMPSKNSNVPWEKLFATSRDGTSLINLSHAVIGYKAGSFLVMSDGKALFGAYVAKEWKDMTKTTGTSEYFLFRLYPDLHVYSMKTGSESAFMYSNTKKASRSSLPVGIGFGVSENFDNFRLWLNDDLQSGKSEPVGNTYRDGLLSHAKTFKIVTLEVWGCGGSDAVKARAEAREKELRESERRKKVDRSALAENWADSPDKWMLDLAGVTGNHADDQYEELED